MTTLIKHWDNIVWYDKYIYTYTYDSIGNMLTNLNQYWVNLSLTNNSLDTYTYNSFGKQLTYLHQNWANDYWNNSSLGISTYDINGNKLTYLYLNWTNNTWKNSGIATYTYDTFGNILTYLSQHWVSFAWENSVMFTSTYDPNANRLSELYQKWGNDKWENKVKEEYVYSPNQVNALAYNWVEGIWIKSLNNNILEIIIRGEDIYFANAISIELYYTDISGIEDPQTNSENSPILCYPNPVTDQINIEIDPAWQAKNYRLELFSQTGQKVKSFEISSTIGSSIAPIRVNDVPPGLYLLRIEAGKQVFSQKIIISK